jgi:hypothetical protein
MVPAESAVKGSDAAGVRALGERSDGTEPSSYFVGKTGNREILQEKQGGAIEDERAISERE